MAIGLVKELTKIGVEIEDTEGTYKAPQADTSYVQPLDGFSVTPSKEEKERNILTAGFSAARSRVGQKSVSASISTEMRGSGIEGGENDFHPLLKAALGGERSISARVTTKTGHTVSRLEIEDADIGSFTVGDIILVLEGGAHFISPVVAKDETPGAAYIDLLRSAASAFSDNVEVAKVKMYYTSNEQADFPTLSMSFYHGDEINERAVGLRPASMALASFSTGELAQYDFSMEGIGFDEVDESAPHDPQFDDATPPLILGACVYKDGAELKLNDFSFSIENTIGFITSTCSEDGRISSRFSGKRAVTGSINPYKDDADISNFESFRDNTAFSLFAFAANPSATDGEYELGSIQAFYMPACIITSKVVADAEGVLIEDIAFRADGGEAGEDTEFYLGSI